MYIIICETDHQSRFDAWDRVLRAGALGWPWGMGWGGRWEGDSWWGTHVHPWLIHVNVWQKPPQYCKVISLQLKKIKLAIWSLKKKKKILKKKKIKIAFLILLSLCPKVHNYYPSIRTPFNVKLWAECPQAWELVCFFLSLTEKGHEGKKPLCIQELLAGYPSGFSDQEAHKLGRTQVLSTK